MVLLKSGDADSLTVRNKLAESVLPTNRNTVERYYSIQQLLNNTDPKFLKKIPGFNDIKNIVITDGVEIWRKASLPIIKSKTVHTKLNHSLISLQLEETVPRNRSGVQ